MSADDAKPCDEQLQEARETVKHYKHLLRLQGQDDYGLKCRMHLNDVKQTRYAYKKRLFNGQTRSAELLQQVNDMEAELANARTNLEHKKKPKKKGAKKEPRLYSSRPDPAESVESPENIPKIRLYSTDACTDQLHEAKREVSKYAGIVRSEKDFLVKCRLQKLNLKVSRWFMKKWQFREEKKNLILLAHVASLEEQMEHTLAGNMSKKTDSVSDTSGFPKDEL